MTIIIDGTPDELQEFFNRSLEDIISNRTHNMYKINNHYFIAEEIHYETDANFEKLKILLEKKVTLK